MENLDELASRVIEIFREKGLSLALAESCTGGMIAETITNVAGASDIFYGSAVTYVNSAKEHILGVAHETLEKHGAVSSECAEEMACGARSVYGADVAMSVTGIAGPGGGSEAKPVGTVWFGLAAKDDAETFRRRFDGDRAAVRRQTVEEVLRRLAEAGARL
ncbi:CinA family protein [uncultured Cloacibacillus sp.]|uniref:CinA family protein n=1 Tax=uncultured Cloacibacillus sp. TaxID=889794 RepID=UPI001F8855FF|nr:CinA family protein [uncultured Cloacibacillus sp.]HIR18389.1 CinA family protein [Candidatus Caccocola faecigallinarum]